MAEVPNVPETQRGFFDRLVAIDRRVIFLFVGLALLVPLFMNVSQKMKISPEVQSLFDAMQALPPGSKVLLACDYDPPSSPELQPMAVTAVKYCFLYRLKMIVIGLWPQGPQQADLAIRAALKDPEVAKVNPQYGIDYCNLGFQAGNEVVIQKMGSDIPGTFPKDWRGTDVKTLPIMTGIKNFSNIDFIFNLSAGYPGTREWVQLAADRFHAKLVSAATAVQTPEYTPYLGRQLLGILGGMKGGAEFEALTTYRGKATKFMLAQSLSHLIVVAFIIIGNAAYFASRKKKGA